MLYVDVILNINIRTKLRTNHLVTILVVSSTCLTVRPTRKLPVEELTANVDFQLADVCLISYRKLHDDVSVRRNVAGTS